MTCCTFRGCCPWTVTEALALRTHKWHVKHLEPHKGTDAFLACLQSHRSVHTSPKRAVGQSCWGLQRFCYEFVLTRRVQQSIWGAGSPSCSELRDEKSTALHTEHQSGKHWGMEMKFRYSHIQNPYWNKFNNFSVCQATVPWSNIPVSVGKKVKQKNLRLCSSTNLIWKGLWHRILMPLNMPEHLILSKYHIYSRCRKTSDIWTSRKSQLSSLDKSDSIWILPKLTQ